jgi:hypothetical protein
MSHLEEMLGSVTHYAFKRFKYSKILVSTSCLLGKFILHVPTVNLGVTSEFSCNRIQLQSLDLGKWRYLSFQVTRGKLNLKSRVSWGIKK